MEGSSAQLALSSILSGPNYKVESAVSYIHIYENNVSISALQIVNYYSIISVTDRIKNNHS